MDKEALSWGCTGLGFLFVVVNLHLFAFVAFAAAAYIGLCCGKKK